MLSECKIFATSLPTKAPLWYTCRFKFISSNAPSNFFLEGPLHVVYFGIYLR